MYNNSLFALSEMDIVEFIAFLSLAYMASATNQTYMSGIRHHLKIRYLPDFQNSFLLNLVLKEVGMVAQRAESLLTIISGYAYQNDICASPSEFQSV